MRTCSEVNRPKWTGVQTRRTRLHMTANREQLDEKHGAECLLHGAPQCGFPLRSNPIRTHVQCLDEQGEDFLSSDSDSQQNRVLYVAFLSTNRLLQCRT